MAYSDFTIPSVAAAFGLRVEVESLFTVLDPLPVPPWLRDQLARGRRMPMASEKARGELIVMPVLLACHELSPGRLTVYSGARLDVDPMLGLLGECDFILARSPPVPDVDGPIVTLVEAKKHDVDVGLGQCAAQMVGARLFNDRSGRPADLMYGCVTSGDVWQFLRLTGSELTVDADRYYLSQLDRVLAAFQAILAQSPAQEPQP